MKFDTLMSPRAESVWTALAQLVKPGRIRELPLDQAMGAVLAADAAARHEYPPFDRAVLDGYAVRSADFVDGRAVLRVASLATAGGVSGTLAPGECVRINTGAIVPPAADAIVAVEEASPVADDRVELRGPLRADQHIERRGHIRRVGATLLPTGARIHSSAMAALAAGGVSTVRVYARPTVALLSTGSELVECGARLLPGQIHDTNSVALAELVRRAGGEVLYEGRCSDDKGALRAALELGLAHDVLIVTGGMSKGTHDLVPHVLEELGARWVINGLDLKPGKPTRIGVSKADGWVLGLPGNPVSCAVCFALFGQPLLSGLQGLVVRPPAVLSARLEEHMPANGARPMYQPAIWRANGHADLHVRPIEWRGSGDPFGMAQANALIYRPSHAPAAREDDAVNFVMLDLPVG